MRKYFFEIKKQFSFRNRWHHDGKRQCQFPFDGRSGTLAHAFFPPDGRLHFDEDEHYTARSSSGLLVTMFN